MKMVSLADVAAFINGASLFLWNSINVILELSYVVGKTLVNQFINLSSLVARFLVSAYYVLKIMYEDSIIFIQDVGEKFVLTYNVFLNCTLLLFNSFPSAVLSIASVVQSILVFLWTCLLSFLLAASNLVLFIQSAVITIKQGFLLVGSSIWLCITIIPASIQYCSNAISEMITQTFSEILSWLLFASQTILSNVEAVLKFFFYVPMDSALGLLLGLIALYLVLRSFRTICFLLLQGSTKVYFYALSFGDYLWTGRFLESKPHEIKTANAKLIDTNTLPQIDQEEKLCVVCQDQTREIIILPCRHMCLCMDCSIQIRRLHRSCPICRSIVRRTMRVYT